MSRIIYPGAAVTLTVPTSAKVALFSEGRYELTQVVLYPSQPQSVSVLAAVNSGAYTTSAFSAAAEITITSTGIYPVHFEVGTDAVVQANRGQVKQRDPIALNATGALTAAAIFSGIVTSTTAAAVTGTLPTGAVMDLAGSFAVDDAFNWSVINTGANAFTVAAAASGHTVVGNVVVAAGKAGRFRTRKTAADTFVTYSLANT